MVQLGMTFIKSLGVLLVALVLGIIFLPLGFLYTIIAIWTTQNRKVRRNSLYLYRIALCIDQLGNVVCAYPFNDLLIEKDGYKFGNHDETISSGLGKNQKRKKFKSLGKWLNNKLNKIDHNHSIKSIECVKPVEKF